MTTAKDYYYFTNVAPDEAGKNYQQAHQAYIYEGYPDAKNIINHIPNLSNDILLEDYMANFISAVPQEIGARLSNMFVAKINKFSANACAVHAKEQYEGDLIYFYVGLSDLLCQYAILFEEFREAIRNDLPDPERENSLAIFFGDLEKISEAQIDWGINWNEIEFKDETVLKPPAHLEAQAVGIACLMDKVVLSHEIAHHLLGHTGVNKNLEHLIKDRIDPLIANDVNNQHRREIEADLLGLALPLWNTFGNTSNQTKFEVAISALLVHTVLSHLKSDIDYESKSHPSARMRYEHVCRFIKEYLQMPEIDSLIHDVEKFQIFLSATQDRGIGVIALSKALDKIK
ncbi:MAG: hypothetical protein JKY53_14965 [Flavobacteriales bacterium]|nr:hypothetical protein [Flavobacteriales bacterium]